MFKSRKDLATPADTHLIELLSKVNAIRRNIERIAIRIKKLQGVDEVLATCPEKTELKDRINRSKKDLLAEFEQYDIAIGDYQRYHYNTIDSRVTTIDYPESFPKAIDIIYKAV